MKRRTPLRARRPTPRRSERVRDQSYLELVHRLTCCAIGLPGHRCEGPIEADHAGERPRGRKASDDTTIPLCRLAHRERTDHTGVFRSWTRDEMRSWLAEQVARTQAMAAKMRARAAAQVGAAPPAYRYCHECGRQLWANHPGVIVDLADGGKARVHRTCVDAATERAVTAQSTAPQDPGVGS